MFHPLIFSNERRYSKMFEEIMSNALSKIKELVGAEDEGRTPGILPSVVETLSRIWEDYGIEVSVKPILHGYQLMLKFKDGSFVVRLYNNKITGLKIDWSQVKNEKITTELAQMITGEYDDSGDDSLYLSNREDLTIIGSDESGKGDIFGGMTVAATLMTPGDRDLLEKEIGVTDSKECTEQEIKLMYDELSRNSDKLIYSGTYLTPAEYNEMSNKGMKCHEILANMHKTAIFDVLEKAIQNGVKVDVILIDQFCMQDVIDETFDCKQEDSASRYIEYKGNKIYLEARPKAESNPAVAASSIIARMEFLLQIEKLSAQYGRRIPLGSGKHAKGLYKKYTGDDPNFDKNEYIKINFNI